jgi:hypothetical protein
MDTEAGTKGLVDMPCEEVGLDGGVVLENNQVGVPQIRAERV